ncbi:hypothetical protein HYH02_011187 [Chlamydomonas schloesseri]|uniref:Uncharacterized protein n=1 Tax=Chlamydomonas schloesseri TaxID=2026947 RepID=A0A835W342_9CHLO|nr:hypothetical protein HYH02_011187 [Chlamydomonas schloesseri]|eukprot:KAG2437545.1 hypothetical protein HYH02_011187 [Chlamydomonas schloesseri]
MPVNFICCFVGSQLPGDEDTAKHAAGRARAKAEKETQTSARCLEGYIIPSAAAQQATGAETRAASDAAPSSGLVPASTPAAALLLSTPLKSAAIRAVGPSSSPSSHGVTQAAHVTYVQPHATPASQASTLRAAELETPERAAPPLAPASNLSDSPIASVRTAPSAPAHIAPAPSSGAQGAPAIPSGARLPPLPPSHGAATPGRSYVGGGSGGAGLSPIPSSVAAGRQSGSGFLESASRQLARAAEPLPYVSYSVSGGPQPLGGGGGGSHGDADGDEYDEAGDRTSAASSVAGRGIRGVSFGSGAGAAGARASSSAAVELGAGGGGVRTVRLPRGLRSPRTSNRALLTRQRTPYALRRYMGGQLVGPRELLDLPAAPSPAVGTGVGATARSHFGAASPSAARAAGTPSYANGGASFRSITTAAAAASAAGRRMHTHSGAAPSEPDTDPAALLDRNSAAAAPGSSARAAAFNAAARSAAIARQTAVRFGVRPLDPGAPSPGPEASVLSPRTTAPALLARQATPCPLRWGRLEDSWDGASEAALSHTLSNTFSHTYSNVMNAVSEHGAPPNFDAGGGGMDVFRYGGRSRAGGAISAMGGGNGSSMAGGPGDHSDRLSAGGVRGFSRAGSIRSGRLPSYGGGGTGAGFGGHQPHPHRALRVNVSLAKSRRSSVSSVMSLDPTEHGATEGAAGGATGGGGGPALPVVVSLRTGGGGGGNTPTRRGRRRNLAGNEVLGWETLVPRVPIAPMGAPDATSSVATPTAFAGAGGAAGGLHIPMPLPPSVGSLLRGSSAMPMPLSLMQPGGVGGGVGGACSSLLPPGSSLPPVNSLTTGVSSVLNCDNISCNSPAGVPGASGSAGAFPGPGWRQPPGALAIPLLQSAHSQPSPKPQLVSPPLHGVAVGVGGAGGRSGGSSMGQQVSFQPLMGGPPLAGIRTREMAGHMEPQGSAFPRPDLPPAPELAAELAPVSSSRGSSIAGNTLGAQPLTGFRFVPSGGGGAMGIASRVSGNGMAGGSWYGTRGTQSSDGRAAIPMPTGYASGAKSPLAVVTTAGGGLAPGGAAHTLRRSCLSMSRPASTANIASAAAAAAAVALPHHQQQQQQQQLGQYHQQHGGISNTEPRSTDGGCPTSGRLAGGASGAGRRVLQHAGSVRSHAPTEDDSAESLVKLAQAATWETNNNITSGTSGYHGNKAADDITTSGDMFATAAHGAGGARAADEDAIASGLIVLGGEDPQRVAPAAPPPTTGIAALVSPTPVPGPALTPVSLASPLRHVLGNGPPSSRLSRCTSLAQHEAQLLR